MSVRDRLPALDESWFSYVPESAVKILEIVGLFALYSASLVFYFTSVIAVFSAIEQSKGFDALHVVTQSLIVTAAIAPALGIAGLFLAVIGNRYTTDHVSPLRATAVGTGLGAVAIGVVLVVGVLV